MFRVPGHMHVCNDDGKSKLSNLSVCSYTSNSKIDNNTC